MKKTIKILFVTLMLLFINISAFAIGVETIFKAQDTIKEIDYKREYGHTRDDIVYVYMEDYPPPKFIEVSDINGDKVLDTLFGYRDTGSGYLGENIIAVNGKTLERFQVDNTTSYHCETLKKVFIPNRLLLPKNKSFYKKIKDKILQCDNYSYCNYKESKDTPMTLDWLLNYTIKKVKNSDYVEKILIPKKSNWHLLKKVDTLEHYYTFLDKNTLVHKVYHLFHIEHRTSIYQTKAFEIFTCECGVSDSGSICSIFAKKGNLYKCLFALDCDSYYDWLESLQVKHVELLYKKYLLLKASDGNPCGYFYKNTFICV